MVGSYSQHLCINVPQKSTRHTKGPIERNFHYNLLKLQKIVGKAAGMVNEGNGDKQDDGLCMS